MRTLVRMTDESPVPYTTASCGMAGRNAAEHCCRSPMRSRHTKLRAPHIH